MVGFLFLLTLNLESGKYKVAALTNNFAAPTNADIKAAPGGKAPSLEEELTHLGMGDKAKKMKSEFHEYIESAVVGMR